MRSEAEIEDYLAYQDDRTVYSHADEYRRTAVVTVLRWVLGQDDGDGWMAGFDEFRKQRAEIEFAERLKAWNAPSGDVVLVDPGPHQVVS